MKASTKTIVAGSTVLILGGWLFFDMYGSAIGYSPLSTEGSSVAAASVARAKTPSARADKTEQVASINPLGGILIQSLSETVERPLFNMSRAPKPEAEPQAEVVAEEEPPASAEDFTLLGIVVASDNKTALVRWNKTNETWRLKAGQSFSQWRLTEIQPKAVVIEGDELKFPLTLFTQPTQPSQLSEEGQPRRRGLPVNPQENNEENQDNQNNLDNQDNQEETLSRLNNG